MVTLEEFEYFATNVVYEIKGATDVTLKLISIFDAADKDADGVLNDQQLWDTISPADKNGETWI